MSLKVERGPLFGFFEPECLDNGGNDQCGVLERGKRDKRDAVPEVCIQLGCHAQSQAGFPYPPCADERHQAYLWPS